MHFRITKRLFQGLLVFGVALFFTLVGYGNLVYYDVNYRFVEHVLSMDTVFDQATAASRGIHNPTIIALAYAGIIFWELLTGLVAWVGLFYGVVKKNWHRFEQFSSIAVFMGIMLYFVGFMIVGGEWFSMWQSKLWDGQQTAARFSIIFLLIFNFLNFSHDIDPAPKS